MARDPPSPPGLEIEAMLRLLYADQGSKQDLLDAVRATRAWALARAPEALAQVRGYLADGGPFPERLHIARCSAGSTSTCTSH